MRYNIVMEKIKTVIIGGGASGLFLATALKTAGKTILFERNDRVGKKLSSTGNGQGNITNALASQTDYFSVRPTHAALLVEIIRAADENALHNDFKKMGVLLSTDERGRVYPASRQASSLTDALRFSVTQKGVDVRLSTRVLSVKQAENGFLLTVENAEKTYTVHAEKVVLCAGGKAAKNFGTDGSAYALAQSLGHSITPVYPSLVQLKTEVAHTKTLKGIRVNDGGLTARLPNGEKVSLRGDIIFTDYGVSGDAVFRISAYIADKINAGVDLEIDLLPDVTEEEIAHALQCKKSAFPDLPDGELLFGIVNNQVGRAVMKRAGGDIRRAAKLCKAFTLPVTGSLGFDYAQVTKGGVPLSEVTEFLESRFARGLYFAGEILDVDGPCGGFNLQWAYSSAMRVADALNRG
ncbi:MAG: aminoacetone oxidase family FAD-binding enzyme [Clostridiales bacterium]|nr:aminoacetone oxidase family FAD-binding enzyme [Clostridiales bacterium]